MDKSFIVLLHQKIRRFHLCDEKEEKEKIRNEIFLKMKPHIIKWLSIACFKNGIFLSKEELLSRSWDCYLFCLNSYKYKNKTITVPNHFIKYTTYYVKKSKIREYESTDKELGNIAVDLKNDKVFEHLEGLTAFKKLLPNEYCIVFDDALMSLTLNKNDRICRIKETSLSTIRYQESKKVFKWFISFLIKGNM